MPKVKKKLKFYNFLLHLKNYFSNKKILLYHVDDLTFGKQVFF